MDESDYIGVLYGIAGFVVFVLTFRFYWAEEMESESMDNRYEKDMAGSAVMAFITALFWPAVVGLFVIKGFLHLITFDMKGRS